MSTLLEQNLPVSLPSPETRTQPQPSCATSSLSSLVTESRPADPENPIPLLDSLIEMGYLRLIDKLDKDCSLGDWLKLVKMRMELTPVENQLTALWQAINQVRREGLASNPAAKPVFEHEGHQ